MNREMTTTKQVDQWKKTLKVRIENAKTSKQTMCNHRCQPKELSVITDAT